MISKRARAKWIAILCALGAIPVCVIGIRHGIRHVRETRAIEALRSSKPAERQAALRELAELRSVRAVPEILSSMASFEAAKRSNLQEWKDLCVQAIGKIGVEAIPVLLSKLYSPKPLERLYAVRFLWRAPELARERPGRALLHLLGDSNPEVREEAADALGFLALKDPPLLEALLDELKRMDSAEDRRVAAAKAIGTTVAPDLGSQAAGESPDGDLDPRERAATVRRAAECLVQSLDDSSLRVREACLDELCEGGPSMDDDIRRRLKDILRRWLTDADLTTRSMALERLDDVFLVRPSGVLPVFVREDDLRLELPQDVLSILGTLLTDPDSGVRLKSAGYLARPEAVPVLMDVLDNGGSSARGEALRVLLSLSGVAAWSAVFDVLERPDASIRPVAVDLLSSMGEREGIGAIRLSQALESRGPEVRRAAARVLARYHTCGSLEAHGLFALLHDNDEAVLVEAAAALSKSGNLDAEDFETRVLKLIDASKPAGVRHAACRAAGGLGPRAESGVPRLVALLEGEELDGREAAAEALGAIGPPARAAVPALLAAVEGKELELGAKALEALAGVSPEDAISPSVRALAHESGRVRDSALAALWSIGSAAAPALPELRKLAAQEKDLDLATRATTLLGRLSAAEVAAPSR